MLPDCYAISLRYFPAARSQFAAGNYRSDRLDRAGHVERYFSEIREGKANTEKTPTPAQSRPGSARLERGTGERRELAGLAHDRAQYSENIRCAVVPQAGDGGRRKLAVCGIDDRA